MGVTFILVHGTFAKKANWPVLESNLADAVEEVGETAQFEQLPWTGKNRTTARELAAASIHNLVQRIWAESPIESIFLIGHSHGGSAIAYFLKNYREMAKRVAGCAFLSTPFVAIRLRQNAGRLFAATIAFPLIAMIVLWFALNVFFIRAHEISLLHSDKIFPSWTFYLGMLAFIVVVLIAKARIANDGKGKILQTIGQQTADIPDGNFLFLRYSGDEAAAVLSAVQFIAWVTMKTSRFLEWMLRSPLNYNPIGLYFGFMGAIIIVFTTVLFFVTSWSELTGMLPYLVEAVRALVLIRGEYSAMVLLVIPLSLLIVPIFFFICLLGASIILFSQAISVWAFGWAKLSVGFFVELAVEPLPFGAHKLVHVNWADASASDSIVHRWTYSHPIAIQHLREWVKTSLLKLSSETKR